MVLMKGEHFSLENGQIYTLLTSDPVVDTAVIIRVKGARALPQEVPYSQLIRDAVEIDTRETQEARAAASVHASPATVARRDLAVSRIKPLVDDPLILEPGHRWRLVVARAKEVDCSPTTLISHLRRYWQGGQTDDALLANFNRSGRCNPAQVERRGRRSTKPGAKNFNLTEVDHENFRVVIKDYYLKENDKTTAKTSPPTIPDAVQNLHERFYSYLDGNGKRYIKAAGEKPTQRQFERFLRKNYPVEMRLRARKGDKDFEQNSRPVLSTIAIACLGVGHIYEMDASILDAPVVSSENRADIAGRPTIYYLIDRHSRLIVGMYVGLENPCWAAALQAIFSIAEDKELLCKRLGIPYDPGDWPAHGVMPQQIYVDRGESMSREATKLGTGLSTTVTNLPSCRPDWKPLVEGNFRLTHMAIADTVPGYNAAFNADKRRTIDFGLQAALALTELESILVKAQIAHNRTIMSAYPMSLAQLAAHIEPSPTKLWNHGVVSRSGQLARFGADTLRLALLPSDDATIDENGIKINGCFYKPETVNRRTWFVEGRVSKSAVKVSYDLRRVDKIYVHDKTEPGGFFIATLTDRSIRFAGTSVAEVKALQRLEEQLKSGAKQSKSQSRLEFHEHARPITKNAIHLKNEAMKGVSKTGRRKNTKTARAAERDLERNRVVPIAPTPPAITAAPAAAPPAVSATGAPEKSVTNNVVALRPALPSHGQDQDPMHTVPNADDAPERPLSFIDKARLARQRMDNGQ